MKRITVTDEVNRWVVAVLYCLGVDLADLTEDQYDELYRLLVEIRDTYK